MQSGLEFLGLGDPTAASWGSMLGDGFNNIYVQPSLMLWPALAIGITIGSLVLLGNAIRDALEDRRQIKAPRRPRPVAEAGSAPEPAVVDDAEAILQVADLSVGYPNADGEYTRVVRDVSLTIRPGEVLGPGRRVRIGQVPDRVLDPRSAAAHRPHPLGHRSASRKLSSCGTARST